MRHILIRIIEIIYKDDFEYSEFQGASIALVWGIWLLIPDYPECIQSLINAVQYLRFLGVVSIILGMCQMSALVFGKLKYRRIASFWAVLFWVYNFVIVASQNWRLVTAPLLFMFALGAAWGYWRTGRIMGSDGNQ